MKNFGAVTQRFRKSRRTFRHDHEFLKIDRRIGMRAAIQNVHHRHRQNFRILASEITKERLFFRGRGGVRGCERNSKQRVRAEIFFIRRPIEFDDLFVERGLLGCIKPDERARDRLVHIAHCFGHAFAAIAFLIAIAQFPRFVFPGARAARNGGAAKSAALQMHVYFNRRVAARIENFTRPYFTNAGVCHNERDMMRAPAGVINESLTCGEQAAQTPIHLLSDSDWQNGIAGIRSLMAISVRWLVVAALISVSASLNAEPTRLPSEAMAKAIKSDSITIPTPGELFAALAKPAKIDWPSQYRQAVPMTYQNRAQIALNLGGLIADGFIAIEARDSQQVKNTGADIIKLAKALGVSQNILGRGSSINEFAENNDWDALQEELEATQNEVKASMRSHQDQDLVILVSLGGWIRGTQVVTAAVQKNYNERNAKVLRQPALVAFIRSKINDISPELRNESLVKEISDELAEIEKMVSFPKDAAPSADDVQKLNAAVTKLMGEIQNKTA